MKTSLKRLTLLAALTGLICCMTACGKSDAVKDDLYSYLTDMTDIQELQREAINEYNSYVTSETSDSQQLLQALNDSIIPKYETYVSELNALAPETEEVQEVKAVCVNGANKQLEALNKVAEAIEACDTDILSEADALIAEAEGMFADYEGQLNILASEHEITLVNGSVPGTGDTSSDDTTEAE